MKILSVVGARPNFMKIAPFVRAIEKYNNSIQNSACPPWREVRIQHLLCHTGQHYDDNMSKAFFEQLNIPEADINLGVGSGTHGQQVGQTIIEFEKVLKEHKPDWVVVVGDVNATLACSVTAKKEWIKCCHIEAGLRSNDITMPEEINRLVTDRVSDLLLTPDKIAIDNLRKEGVPEERIKFVGNIMIDTLLANKEKTSVLDINKIVGDNSLKEINTFNLSEEEYGIITIHRPSNVDNQKILSEIIEFLCEDVSKELKLIFPMHPRTKSRLLDYGLMEKLDNNSNIVLTSPLGYLEMLRLNMTSKIMLTDSGGLQEECTVLGTPCLTLRWNTERPVTLREHGGVSVLVGNNIQRIRDEFYNTIKMERNPYQPELWDGHTAERCLEAIINYKG